MNRILSLQWVASLWLALGLAGTALAAPPECAPPSPGAPMFVTAECTDPVLDTPVVDIDEWRDTPVRHRYVNGHFEGHGTRFSFYFPPPEHYDSRFFQYTQPAPSAEPGAEDAAAGNIEFARYAGAYFVQTNNGASITGDQTIPGYRADAASAKFAEQLADDMYGPHDPFGYRYGGSGGGYKTIAGAENTSGIWDGHMPFVIGSPMAIPNVYSIRANALRVLRRGDKCPALIDAIEPGGSGDIYAGLNDEERGALLEATRFGFPPRGWYACEFMGVGALPLVFPLVAALDPQYFINFWTKPGYLGTDPASSVRDDRVQFATEVQALVPLPPATRGPQFALQLASPPPPGDFTSYDLVVLTGDAAGQVLPMAGMDGAIAYFSFNASADTAAQIQPGDEVRVDNSSFLALQTYHRHQVPTPDFYVFDQFRAPDGTPLYPQSSPITGPLVTGTGSVQNGRFTGKMIVIETLMDIDALPWQADWYRQRVLENLGQDIDDEFRLYFYDNADHGSEIVGPLNGQIVDPNRSPARLVPYRPALEQGLMDLVAWVEDGIPPPPSTQYTVRDGQVLVPDKFWVRRGIQPLVQVWARGRERTEVAVGQPVTFVGLVDMPPQAGLVVDAEWDFEGIGTYPGEVDVVSPRQHMGLRATHVYTKPGTYYPVLRVTSQRQEDFGTRWGLVKNLARVRVVVK